MNDSQLKYCLYCGEDSKKVKIFEKPTHFFQGVNKEELTVINNEKEQDLVCLNCFKLELDFLSIN